MPGLKELIREVHRRSLWQVLGLYVGSSWFILQVVNELTEAAGLPEWFPSLALGLLLLGFPLVLATAFVQEGVGSRETRSASAPETGEKGRPRERTEPPPDRKGPAPTLARDRAGPEPSSPRGDEEAGRLRRLLTWRNVLAGGVLAFAAWGVIAAGWVLLEGSPVGSPDAEARKSIAVLPFGNMSEDPENEYFSDGITDDIIIQLSKVSDLKVISRTSTMRYKETDKSLRQIGEELDVGSVLEGGVRREGEVVRINAQLIDARTDEHLWAESYDRKLTDIFAIQSEVALRIAEALRARLTRSERERIETRPTESAEAYELYLRGRQLWYERTRLDSAVLYFQRALDEDPGFAQAYARLADVHVVFPNRGLASPRTAYPLAKRYARRAIALDSLLGEPRAALAFPLYTLDHDWDAAEREFRQALELSPSYATGHYWYSYYLFRRGRVDEAIERGWRAEELDPRSPAIRAGLGGRLYFARRYREAEEQLEGALELNEDSPAARLWLGLTRIARQRPGEGIPLVEGAASGAGELTTARAILAYAYAAGGRPEEARSLLRDLEGSDAAGYAPPTWVAAARAALGEKEAAFRWLERAYEERDEWLTNIGQGPWMDPLRDDPRFAEMLQRIGLS